MLSKRKVMRFVLMVLTGLMVAACGPVLQKPFKTSRAQLGPVTPETKELSMLPEPQEPIVVAVYKFRDQTGQYKPSETGASWSTAVTQGATTILINALEKSGWFIPIERENMSNLLNERKIIRSSRMQYQGANESDQILPPLLFAGVLLEGGIISYESNVITGGAGLRYFGAGASGQYREDRVSIFIRAVSTSNGKILKTVQATKSILSQQVGADLFRYVKFKRILEAETGFTYNEPSEIAVTEAIEKAVQSLIFEGIEEHLWAMKNPADTAHHSFEAYKMEKNLNSQVDFLGRRLNQYERGRILIGVSGKSSKYTGDYASSTINPAMDAEIGLRLNNYLYANAFFGYGTIGVEQRFSSKEYNAGLNLRFVAAPFNKVTPYLTAGAGSFLNDKVGKSDDGFIPFVRAGVGISYLLNKRMELSLFGNYNYHLTDQFDGVTAGYYNDADWSIGARIQFHLFNSKRK